MVGTQNNKYFQELKKLKKNEFLSGENFSKIADVIYAQTTTYEEFQKIDEDNLEFFEKNENSEYTYSIKNFEIKENDIIFCKTDFLLELFSKLKKVENLKNIKLITHQAALPSIDKGLYNLKPKCISEWYSINLKTRKKNLFPIPLGLGNSYNKIGLKGHHFYELYKKITNTKELNLIYCNFKTSSNPVRESLLEKFKDNSNFIFDNPELEIKEYHERILNYKYILCPEGLGMDTHRFWEVIYSGSIPIAKKFINNEMFESYFIDLLEHDKCDINSFKKITLDMHLSKKLSIRYWQERINEKQLDSNETKEIKSNDSSKILYFKLKRKYTKYKVMKSSLDFRAKLRFIKRINQEIVIDNYNKNLFNRFWFLPN